MRQLWIQTMLLTVVVGLFLTKPAVALGPNLALGKYVTCSSQAGGPYVASNLTDGNQNTAWQGTKWPDWCMIDLGSVHSLIYVIEKYPVLSGLNNAAVTRTVWLSADRNNWVKIIDGTGSFYPDRFRVATPLNPSIQAQYIWITFNPNHVRWINGNSSGPLSAGMLGELEAYEQ